MPRCVRRKRIFRCLFSAAIAVSLCMAQEFRSTVSGVVRDPQGALIPGATVIATSADTGANFKTVSETDGQYSIPFVPPGTYNFNVTAPGFKTYARTGIVVNANERLPLDVTLEVGQVSETMSVSADAAMLETSTASSGQVINSRQIENIPLNGRTPLTLAQLAFGVIPNSDPRFNRPFDNGGPSGFSIGGAPSQTNEILLDGAPDVTSNDRVSYNPPVDAVQEVKVEIFQADAAYGHTGGGTVNQITKSGTNQLHGTAYEFNQTSALESRNFFLSRSGQKLPVGRFNQYGTTVGGPWCCRMCSMGEPTLLFLWIRRHQGFLSRDDRNYSADGCRTQGRLLATAQCGIELSDLQPVHGCRERVAYLAAAV